jgi:hypothetical protein
MGNGNTAHVLYSAVRTRTEGVYATTITIINNATTMDKQPASAEPGAQILSEG